MSQERSFERLRLANPVPAEMVDGMSLDHAALLAAITERTREMQTRDDGGVGSRPPRGHNRWLFAAAVFAVTIIAIGLVTFLNASETASSPSERATEFWEAAVAGDTDAALAAVDPDALASGSANLFGRAYTLEGQFDWYETVAWEWTLEECVEVDAETSECTATARNAWSDVLGVDPITGTFEIRVEETGITNIAEDGSFVRQWSPLVAEVFSAWVETNHPEDARVMFNLLVDVDPEILELYRINSTRFTEAHSG